MPASKLFDAIAAESKPRLSEFNPQELANTAWAFATAGVPAPELFDEIAAESKPRLSEFNPQELTSTAWAFATAGVPAPELFDEIATASKPRLKKFNPQDLANTAWAFAVTNKASSALLGEIADCASRCIDDFELEGLTQLHLVTIEVDGPSHFGLRSTAAAQQLDASTRFKQRILEAHGWRVICIPYFEWVTKSKNERRPYLRSKLATEPTSDAM